MTLERSAGVPIQRPGRLWLVQTRLILPGPAPWSSASWNVLHHSVDAGVGGGVAAVADRIARVVIAVAFVEDIGEEADLVPVSSLHIAPEIGGAAGEEPPHRLIESAVVGGQVLQRPVAAEPKFGKRRRKETRRGVFTWPGIALPRVKSVPSRIWP